MSRVRVRTERQRGLPLTWPRRGDLIALSEEEEKRRSNRQPLAAARGRTGEQNARQPLRQDCWLPVRENWPCWRHGSTQPGSKRPLETIATALGVWGRPAPTRSPAHASSTRHERPPCSCMCSACSRRPQAGRTAHPHGGAVAEQRTTRMLASPCVGASSAGGSLRVASATCALQPQLVPRRQSEAGASRLMGANRHGGWQRRPRWSWKLPFERERIQGRR